jgi:hypothetical protein
MGIMDYKAAKGATGEKEPKGATSSDRTGERKAKSMRGGVAMGKEDMIGADKLFNTGRTEGICYEHKKDGYR